MHLGGSATCDKGYWVNPTIFNVPEDMCIGKENIFGRGVGDTTNPCFNNGVGNGTITIANEISLTKLLVAIWILAVEKFHPLQVTQLSF